MNPKTVKTYSVILTTTLEVIVFAEILWYYLHDGESTLHGAAAAKGRKWFARLQHDTQVADTLESIRNLPETDG